MSALYVSQSSNFPSRGSQSSVQQQTGSQYSSGGNNNAQQSGRSLPSNKNRKSLFCTFCQLQGHLWETCYKLHGYPPGFKFNNNKGAGSNTRGNKSVANNVVNETSCNGDKDQNNGNEVAPVQISSLQMTPDQLNKLMSFLGGGGSQTTDHIAGSG
ncbi:hypothetical protein QQ045_029783 [Rhodiola kirilowii]